MDRFFILIIIICITTSCDLFENQNGVPVNENPWVNGYLGSWQHDINTFFSDDGVLTTDEIDWDALTHLTYLSLVIDGNGTPQPLSPFSGNSFNTDRINAIIPAAHQNNVKILFNVRVDEDIDHAFTAAIADSSRNNFVDTIANMINTYGFDGVNIQMDTLETPADEINYRKFIRQLSSTFDNITTANNGQPLISLTAIREDSLMQTYADLQAHFDQINIPTYSMNLPWRGWHAWHHSALQNKDVRFRSNSEKLPSIHQKVQKAQKAGISQEKIGIGINFYGYVWNTVNLGEIWTLWPSQDMSIIQGGGSLPFTELSERYNLSDAEWDENANVPYLDESDPKVFVSFDNERSVRQKVRYAKEEYLGGIFIWELGGAHFENRPTHINPLLSSIKQEVFNPDPDTISND